MQNPTYSRKGKRKKKKIDPQLGEDREIPLIDPSLVLAVHDGMGGMMYSGTAQSGRFRKKPKIFKGFFSFLW